MSTTYINIQKIKVPWSLLSESVVYFFATLFQVFDYHNKEYPLKKFEQFWLCKFEGIYMSI